MIAFKKVSTNSVTRLLLLSKYSGLKAELTNWNIINLFSTPNLAFLIEFKELKKKIKTQVLKKF